MSGGGRIYVGNIPYDTSKRELDDVFYKFGKIETIDIKYPRENRGTAYAFVQFRDSRDADDAVHGRDGYRFDDRHRMRVEHSSSRGRNDDRGGRSSGGRDGGHRGDRDDRRDNPRVARGPPPSKYKVRVTGLPEKASWQDLKDFIRPVGKSVTFTEVVDGIGTCGFEFEDDLLTVIKELDGALFKNRYDESRVTIKELPGDDMTAPTTSSKSEKRDRSRSRSRDRRESRSASRSEERSNRKITSPSKSPQKKRDDDEEDDDERRKDRALDGDDD